jgi:hypothetical protein
MAAALLDTNAVRHAPTRSDGMRASPCAPFCLRATGFASAISFELGNLGWPLSLLPPITDANRHSSTLAECR